MWNTTEFLELINRTPKNDAVILDLTQIDGNAFSLMGSFLKTAKRQGWSSDDINIVLNECKTDTYDHLVCTLLEVTTTEEQLDEEALDEEYLKMTDEELEQYLDED